MAEGNVFLRAATTRARKSINRSEAAVDKFPFRVGRESRLGVVHGHFAGLDKRRSNIAHSNDLYMRDSCRELHVSREHFQIERTVHGDYELVDRGSTCGMVVDDDRVGGHGRGGRHALSDGSNIVVGRSDSPFVFTFHCSG